MDVFVVFVGVCLIFFSGVIQALLNRHDYQKKDSSSSSANNLISVTMEDLKTILRNPLRPSIEHHSLDGKFEFDPVLISKQFGRGNNVGHFSWKTCGGSSDPVQITNLTITPDPIKLGQPIKVTASGTISLELGSPIEVDVVVQKKVFVWVTLPCVDGLGSCSYPDLCARLPPPPCPQPLIEANLPCSCPFPAGTYTVNDLEVEFDSTKFPEWLTEGDFKAHITLKKNGQIITCYDVELNMVGMEEEESN